MQTLDDRVRHALDSRAAAGRLRSLKPVERLAGGRVRLGSRVLLDCSSNDYLGLSHHPVLIERARHWAAAMGAGAGASRLVTGHSPELKLLEAKLAALKGAEAALIFASGWQCNASVLPAILDPEIWDGAPPPVFADRLIHASLHAGCQIAGIQPKRFRHNDLDHLTQLLDREQNRPALIITESVFSMDGDRVDVAALSALAATWGATTYLDEAHATGVLGPQGMGLSPGQGISIAMGTFSKAMGGFGAYVAGSKALIEYLVNRASGLVYATGLPPAVLGAMDAALDLVPAMERERAALARHATTLRDRLNEAGLNTGLSTTQIVPVILGEEATALAAQAALEDAGILAVAIRPPTVPPGGSRLRLTLSAAHSDDDIQTIARAVIACCRPMVTV